MTIVLNPKKKSPEKSPDETVYFSYENANERLNDFEMKTLTITDIILILLYAQPDNPLYGRVSIMKQFFLLITEVLNEYKIQDPKFIPYRFGMYSFTVGNVIDNLEYSGFIVQKGKKNTKMEQFSLSEKGKERISRTFNSIPSELQEKIKEKRKGWDQLGYKGILRLVYQKYPEYVEKSHLKNKYKSIKWGRGKG